MAGINLHETMVDYLAFHFGVGVALAVLVVFGVFSYYKICNNLRNK